MDEQLIPVADSPEGTTETGEQQPQATEQSQVETPPTGQEVQEESGESFFDPTSIPEELKPAYKQMQAAFTKKTQEIAEQRKEVEALRQKAEQYDKYQQHIPMIEEMLANRKPAPEAQNPELEQLRTMYKEAGYSDEAIEMMEKGLSFVLNHFNQTKAAERQQEWVNTQVAEASKLDPRLTDASLVYQTEDGESVTFGQMVESIAMTDPNVQKDIIGATRRAINRIDALIGKAKTQGKEELSNATKAKAAKFPTTHSSPQSATETAVRGSISEIGKQTAAELGIKI